MRICAVCEKVGAIIKIPRYLIVNGLPRNEKLAPYVCSRCDKSQDSVYRKFKVNHYSDEGFFGKL
jgi:hypothetical protein